jgi:hypothetical protein
MMIKGRHDARIRAAVCNEDGMASLLGMGHLFRRGGPVTDLGGVDIGDRFFKPGQRNQIWTVERIFKPAANMLTHVVLRRGGENPETYVISAVALMNPHMFRRDRREPDSVNVRARSRRAMDYVKDTPHTSEDKVREGEDVADPQVEPSPGASS